MKRWMLDSLGAVILIVVTLMLCDVYFRTLAPFSLCLPPAQTPVPLPPWGFAI